MVLNIGDADCNDGYWGEVWQRNTGEHLANIVTIGDMDTAVETHSRELEKLVELVIDVVLISAKYSSC